MLPFLNTHQSTLYHACILCQIAHPAIPCSKFLSPLTISPFGEGPMRMQRGMQGGLVLQRTIHVYLQDLLRTINPNRIITAFWCLGIIECVCQPCLSVSSFGRHQVCQRFVDIIRPIADGVLDRQPTITVLLKLSCGLRQNLHTFIWCQMALVVGRQLLI